MAARIAQDGRVPLFGEPMPLKGRKEGEGGERSRGETIWDAQQGGLAFVGEPGISAQMAQTGENTRHLAEERRMEHLFVPCYAGDWVFTY